MYDSDSVSRGGRLAYLLNGFWLFCWMLWMGWWVVYLFGGVGGPEFIILECVPSVKKMFFHAEQALHTSHITRTQFRYFITRDCACLNLLK